MKRLRGGFRAALNFLRSAKGQLTAGVTAMATLVWLLWPSPQWNMQPEPTVAFTLALMAWLLSLSDARDGNSSSAPTHHDRLLLQKIAEKLSHNLRLFLRKHHFGASFQSAILVPLYDVANGWVGADYAFDDVDLDSRFTALRCELDAFLKALADEAYGIADTDLMAIVPEDERVMDWFEPDTVKRVDAMNDRASSIADSIDTFIMTARRRLGPNTP